MQAVMEIDDDDDIMEVSVPPDDDNDDMINTVRLHGCISLPKHKQMVTHVIWPRKLPSKNNTDEYETPLMALMTDTLEWLENSMDCVTSCSKLFRGMYNTNTSTDAQVISSEINRLKYGEMFGFFVKNQNCGVSVYIPLCTDKSSIRPSSAIVSTFPVLIPTEEIYDATHSEFQVIFPFFYFDKTIETTKFIFLCEYFTRLQLSFRNLY